MNNIIFSSMRRANLTLLISCMLLAACKQKQPPQVPPVPVNLFTVKAHNVFYYDKYPANIVALSQVDLRPQVQGYITGMSFTEGDHVRKGRALYEIDRQLYQEVTTRQEPTWKWRRAI